MSMNYEIQRDGDKYLAQSIESFKKDVQIEADLVEHDDEEIQAYETWEDLIVGMLGDGMTEYLHIDPGQQQGRIELEQAKENLVENISNIDTEYEAEAYLACLYHNEILEFDDGEIILFQNPIDMDDDSYEQLDHSFLYNWTAALKSVREGIIDHIEQVKEQEEKLKQEAEKIPQNDEGNLDIGAEIGSDIDLEIQDPKQALRQIDERMKSLGDGENYPEMSNLKPAEKNRVKLLQQQADIQQVRLDLREGSFLGDDITDFEMDVEDWITEELGSFGNLYATFKSYEENMRYLIIYKEFDQKRVGQLLDDLVDIVMGLGQVENSYQEQSLSEWQDEMEETLEASENASETAEELAEEARNEGDISPEKEEEIEERTEMGIDDILEEN